MVSEQIQIFLQNYKWNFSQKSRISSKKVNFRSKPQTENSRPASLGARLPTEQKSERLLLRLGLHRINTPQQIFRDPSLRILRRGGPQGGRLRFPTTTLPRDPRIQRSHRSPRAKPSRSCLSPQKPVPIYFLPQALPKTLAQPLILTNLDFWRTRHSPTAGRP